MSDIDLSDKTEPATTRRRLELRQRGQVARSGDLTTAASILAAAAALHFFGADVMGALAELLRKSLSAPPWNNIELVPLMQHLRELAQLAARATAPILALLALAAIAINLAQVGFLATMEPLTPDLGRLNPFAGLRRLWSGRGPAVGLASLLKLSVLAAIAAGFVTGQLPGLIRVGDYDLAGLSQQVGGGLVRLGFQMAIGLDVVAVADYAFQLWRFERGIRMTKEELRDELRQTEGDPQVRQRRREAHRKLNEPELPSARMRRNA
jgi:flagellar biosynthetic protein FlhB